MSPRIPTLDGSAILLAEGGAAAHEQANSIAAFALAVRLGATGLSTTAWMTADGQVILGSPRRATGFRRRPVSAVDRSSLPAATASVDELFEALPGGVAAYIGLGDLAVVDGVLASARDGDGCDRLWLAHTDWRQLATLRSRAPRARLVEVTRLKDLEGGPERHAADLREAGVDAIAMHESDWSAGMVTLFHRFRRYTVARDAQHDHSIERVLRIGIDAAESQHVDRLVDAATRHA